MINETQINHYFLNDDRFNVLPEYVAAVDKIWTILRGKRGSLRPELKKIKTLNFDAIILIVKLTTSCEILLNHLLKEEDYETCAILRDINDFLLSQFEEDCK